MDVAQTLVRSVMRAFYSTQEILVIEALVTHSCLRDDDLIYLMKMNSKDLHKLCASLRDARFLIVHTRPEVQKDKARPINRIYYYIDYRQAIDAIKWRVYKTDKDMQVIAHPADETKEYTCPRCTAQWTQMEVLDSVSTAGFVCQRCGTILELSKEREAPGHQQLSRMNNQFKFMTDMLQEVDKVVVPECNFDTAMQTQRPIVRDANHGAKDSTPVDTGLHKPSAVKGLANVGPKTMHVTIMGDGEEHENTEARKRKERLLRENALPVWMTESSVPIKSKFQPDENDHEEGAPAKRVKMEATIKTEVKIENPVIKVEADDDDDDDDFEFEDVV
ncbi:transcription initiation factor TFIIE-like protein [Cercophora scortea]|uniref:Transcription initiation factor TFIIE-like protein n=1 Tax=Cercophora scortea TaxID=314031 RepID=A0AAE0IMB6_9PEZI|nr:transcription initiation factor TFIIE-like protein [Cercophora scortea]